MIPRGLKIWAYLIVHHAISALTAQASATADLDPDSISFAEALRLIRRTATGTAAFPLRTGMISSRSTWPLIAALLIPPRRKRTLPASGQTRPAQQLPGSRSPANGQAPTTTPTNHQPAPTPTISLINLRYVPLSHSE